MKAPARSWSMDRRVGVIFVILVGAGVYLVASSGSFFAAVRFSDPYFLIKRHLVRLFVGLLFFFMAMKIDYRIYRKLAVPSFVASVALLLLLFVGGKSIRGTEKWFVIEGIHTAVQPSEFMRLALVMFLAYWISRAGREIEELKKGFLPAAGAIVIVVGLIVAQPSFGIAGATLSIGVCMLFLGGARIRHLAGFIAVMAIPVAVRLWSAPYARERLMAFIERGEDFQRANWQVYQSLVGLGAGGIFGTGFGESLQKLNWLPDSHTDFIFSILGEEVGLLGTFLISALFLLLVLRTMKLSQRCPDTFGELMAAGLGASIFIYAVLNMAVATGLMPVTGLPLPFISYGGSALLVNCVSVGILLNISKGSTKAHARRRKRVASTM